MGLNGVKMNVKIKNMKHKYALHRVEFYIEYRVTGHAESNGTIGDMV